jgi:hypothetical protein
VSSSFFVRRGPPDDAAAIVAALDRSGVRWADGELEELNGPWPEGVVLLWIPGASTRGVEVTVVDGRMCVRILAMSSPEDYDLAFRLVEVLGGDGQVEPEEGEPVKAAEVRAKFDQEWIAKNMATGAAGIGAALARGKRVTVSGPGTSVRIEPVQPFDAVAFLDSMRNAQVSALAENEKTERAGQIVEDDERTPWQEIEDGDLLTGEQEHQEELQARDKKLARVKRPAPETPPSGLPLLSVVAMVFLIVPALVVCLVTLPFRGMLRKRRAARLDERRQRERSTCRDEVVRETAHLETAPDDLDARRRRADRLNRLGHRAAAERDLTYCLDKLPEKAPERAAVLVEHAAILRALGCPNLAAAAQAEAIERGAKAPPESSSKPAAAGAGGMFLRIAGLAD